MQIPADMNGKSRLTVGPKFCFAGHTSGADILWAGVPTLTLAGIKQSARVGASLLTGLGLEGLLVARTMKDYTDIAVAAGGEAGMGLWLREVRAALAKVRLSALIRDYCPRGQGCSCQGTESLMSINAIP